MTSKNNCIEKDGFAEALFSSLLRTGLVFAKGDDDWKNKRKHTAHAFMKESMYDMQENFKVAVMKSINKWIEEIKSSPDGKTTINIAEDFM